MDNIYLVGHEEVQRAGYTMVGAAADMIRAASAICEAVNEFRLQIDRVEGLMKERDCSCVDDKGEREP